MSRYQNGDALQTWGTMFNIYRSRKLIYALCLKEAATRARHTKKKMSPFYELLDELLIMVITMLVTSCDGVADLASRAFAENSAILKVVNFDGILFDDFKAHLSYERPSSPLCASWKCSCLVKGRKGQIILDVPKFPSNSVAQTSQPRRTTDLPQNQPLLQQVFKNKAVQQPPTNSLSSQSNITFGDQTNQLNYHMPSNQLLPCTRPVVNTQTRNPQNNQPRRPTQQNPKQKQLQALLHNDYFFWTIILNHDQALLVANPQAAGILCNRKIIRSFICHASYKEISRMRFRLYYYRVKLLGYNEPRGNGFLRAIFKMTDYFLSWRDTFIDVSDIHEDEYAENERVLSTTTPGDFEQNRALVLTIYDQIFP